MCTHSELAEIDRQLILGVAAAALSPDFDLSEHALKRHRADHLAEALTGVVIEQQKAGARSALARLEDLAGVVDQLLAQAQDGGKTSLALASVRELRNLLETIAKITGELNDRPQVAIFQLGASEEWAHVSRAMLEALGPYPEARQAVAGALGSLPALNPGAPA